MEFVRTILHQLDSPFYKEWWSQTEKNIGFKLSDSTRSAIITSLLRSVFNCCQQVVVSVKEGETLLLKSEQYDVDDEFAEAGMDIDEAYLYCWVVMPFTLPLKLTKDPQSL